MPSCFGSAAEIADACIEIANEHNEPALEQQG